MISKYFSRAWLLALSLLLLSSCLNSSDENVEYSPDAQIYAFSLSSASDTAGLLSATKFTIDQINGKIFNKEPLPFQFQVDSVLLSITGFSTYNPYTLVQLQLYPDSTYYWVPSDSVAVHRLKRIITTAADGITQKTYDFALNIYQQDPYLLSWEQRNTGYLPTSVESQKTIAFQNQFITYYKSGSAINAMFTDASDGTTWSDANITGLPPTLQLSSLVAANNAAFGLDITTDSVYKSTDGVNWSPVYTQYPVKAIYGELPLATNDDHDHLLAAVEINGELTFVETDDFTVLKPLNKLPQGLPVKDFSATKVDASTSYSIKYIILSGGTTIDNMPNNDIWILQEKDGNITHILSRKPATGSVSGSSLFFYDNKPYLIVTSSGKNILMYSENFGLDWIAAAENQSFPTGFDQRTNASIITDAANYIWIFGGISVTQTQLSDVWRGRLNKFATQ
jgi:hypothetical protein